MSKKLMATAYHEAGHAVAAWKLHIRLRKVTIVPKGDADGYVERRGIEWPKRIREALEFGGMTDAMAAYAQWWAERHAVYCVAGEEAQRRFSPSSVRHYQSEGDRDSALEGIGRLVPDEDLPLYWRILRNQSRRLINRNWKAVKALASELIKRKTLTGEEARRIILTASAGKDVATALLAWEERLRKKGGTR